MRPLQTLHVAIARTVWCASLGALGGCGSLLSGDRVNPEVPIWYHRPAGVIDVVMRRELTAPSRTAGEAWERGRPEIDPEHDRVFVGSSDHGLYALRAGDGSTIWRFETLGLVQSEPYYDRELDYVYFGSHDGGFYCVRAATGQLVFRFDAGAEVWRRPVVAGETLVFANAADYLFAVERRTGKPIWQVHRTPSLGMEISGHAGPAFDRELQLVFMAYSDGHVIAYDVRDGSEKWAPVDLSVDAEQANGEAARYLDVDTTPVVDDGPRGKVVYVSSYAGGVVALDARTGAREWSNDAAIGVTDLSLFEEAAHEPPRAKEPRMPAYKVLLAASASSGLQGLDPLTGRTLWRNPVPDGGISKPVPIGGALLVGTTRYGLFLLSPRNGRVIDGLDLDNGFAQTPAAYGSRAFAMTNTGTLLGISLVRPSRLSRE